MVQRTIIPFPSERIVAKFRGAVLTCAQCGSEFRVPPVRAKTARYCSRPCADLNRSAMQEHRKKRVVLKCAGCDKPFETFGSHVSRRTFCSRPCQNKAWSNATAGHRKSVKWEKRPGLSLHSDGYVLEWCPDHPFASGGYVMQHRLVIERWLRKNEPDSGFLVKLGNQMYLRPDIEVHHKDEVKSHNQIGNLECLTRAEHARIHSNGRHMRR